MKNYVMRTFIFNYLLVVMNFSYGCDASTLPERLAKALTNVHAQYKKTNGLRTNTDFYTKITKEFKDAYKKSDEYWQADSDKKLSVCPNWQEATIIAEKIEQGDRDNRSLYAIIFQVPHYKKADGLISRTLCMLRTQEEDLSLTGAIKLQRLLLWHINKKICSPEKAGGYWNFIASSGTHVEYTGATDLDLVEKDGKLCFKQKPIIHISTSNLRTARIIKVDGDHYNGPRIIVEDPDFDDKDAGTLKEKVFLLQDAGEKWVLKERQLVSDNRSCECSLM